MAKECEWCGRTYQGSQYDPYCSRRCQRDGRIDKCGEDREQTTGELLGDGCRQVKQGVANEVGKYIWIAVVIGVIALVIKCC